MLRAIARLAMIMNKPETAGNRIARTLTIQGEAGGLEKSALACDAFMLGILGWNQIRYGMDMLFLIIPLVLVGIYLLLFGVIAEAYYFINDSLEIRHRFRKTIAIPYDAVFQYEAQAHDSFINIAQSNKVKVYYAQGHKKSVVLCRPEDTELFVETLKWNCPEFHENPKEKSRLEVFFSSNE